MWGKGEGKKSLEEYLNLKHQKVTPNVFRDLRQTKKWNVLLNRIEFFLESDSFQKTKSAS